LDRSYRDLKAKFFSKEIGKGRPEMYEVKGNDLVKPRNKDSRRRHTFLRRVLDLCAENQGAGFAVIFKKNPIKATSKTSMYTMALQYLVERFSFYLEETAVGVTNGIAAQDCQGIIIADTRMRNLDLNVATSHLSFIFGHPTGQQCERIIEAPTFTHSELSVGIQLTDIFASCLYAQYYRRTCGKVPGALDYSHMGYVEPYTDKLQWSSVKAYKGFFMRGFRYLDHSVGA